METVACYSGDEFSKVRRSSEITEQLDEPTITHGITVTMATLCTHPPNTPHPHPIAINRQGQCSPFFRPDILLMFCNELKSLPV